MHRKLPIFYSALLLTGVNLLLRLVSTSFQVHISSRIGAAGVGLLQLVLSIGSLAMTAGMAGIRTATMYLTANALGKKQPQSVTWILSGCFLYSILCSCTIGGILYVSAPYLAENWVGNPQTLSAIRLFSFCLPLICLCGCMTGYFTAANRIGTLAAVEVAEQACYMCITMAALHLWAGTDPARACEAVVLGSGVSSCLTLLCLVFLRLKERPSTGPRIPVGRSLLATAVPLALADDLKAGISTTENLMVPKRLALCQTELTPLATFGTVCGMVFPVMMFPAAILFALAELLIPELARCHAAGSLQRIPYLVKRSLKVAMVYGCLCSGLLFLLAKPLCLSLYNNEDAGRYLQVYSILVPMLYCDAITDAMTKGLGQQQICVRYNILTSSMDVALLYILLPRYGMTGYLVSFFITHLINFLLSLRLLTRISGVHIPFYVPVLTVGATMGSALGASLVSTAAGQILAFLCLCACLLYLFGILRKEDLLWARGLLSKK